LFVFRRKRKKSENKTGIKVYVQAWGITRIDDAHTKRHGTDDRLGSSSQQKKNEGKGGGKEKQNCVGEGLGNGGAPDAALTRKGKRWNGIFPSPKNPEEKWRISYSAQ